MRKFHFYADPGHGWAKVPLSLLHELNIVDQITPYSYMNGKHVYLEEDLDMYTFVHYFTQWFGYAPSFTSHHTNRNSKIRSYPSFRST